MSSRGANLQRCWVSPEKVVLCSCEDLDGVAVVGAAGGLALSTDHRGGGAHSIEWDKLGTATLGGVALTLDDIYNLADYDTHSQLMIFARIPTPVGGTIVRAYIALGTDAANLFYWEILPADITYDAWAHYHLLMSEVDGIAGVGANLLETEHIGFYILTDVAGATLTNVRIDEIIVKRGFEVVFVQEKGKPIEVKVSVAGTEEPEWLVTDKDVEFTGAIAVNAKEDENLAGLAANKIVITDVLIEGLENLAFRLLFWSTDDFDNADEDLDTFLGFVDLDIPNNGFQIGAANQYYLNVTDINLHYEDEDATNELHVSLNCVTAAGKTAGAPGEVKVKIGYKVRE